MNDPHVQSLEYQIVPDATLVYDNPPRVERETEEFYIQLADGVLTVTMKAHYATEDEARAAVRPFIRAWEIDGALKHGRPEFRFDFQRANVIDRAPPAPQTGPHLTINTGSVVVLGESVILRRSSREYHGPPDGFTISPDVETLWDRYEGYLAGREPLPGMAYFCLTVIEAVYKGRKKAAPALNIDDEVLNKLGELTSTRGDAATARKHKGPLMPLAASESEWIREVVKALIRRFGMFAAGTTIAAPLRMGDLPKL
jgi:hypothetical protein